MALGSPIRLAGSLQLSPNATFSSSNRYADADDRYAHAYGPNLSSLLGPTNVPMPSHNRNHPVVRDQYMCIKINTHTFF